MALTRKEFAAQYDEAHRKLLGRPANSADINDSLENYQTGQDISGSDNGVLLFGTGEDGKLSWDYTPNKDGRLNPSQIHYRVPYYNGTDPTVVPAP